MRKYHSGIKYNRKTKLYDMKVHDHDLLKGEILHKYHKKSEAGVTYNKKTKLWDITAWDHGLLRSVGSQADKEGAQKYKLYMEGVFKGLWKDTQDENKSGRQRYIKKDEADLKFDKASGTYPVLAWYKGKVYEMGSYQDRREAWKVKREAEAEFRLQRERNSKKQ